VEHDTAKLQTKIERAIKRRFRLPVKVVVLDRAAYMRIVKAIPTSWVDDASVSANVAFVRRGTDAKQVARELRADPAGRTCFRTFPTRWSPRRLSASRR
jgi:uncharacterized protein (DUF1697 family)